MELMDYIPVLIQVGLALAIGAAVLIVSQIMGQRSPRNRFKDSAYECGLPPEGERAARFSVKFYLTAMLFILFDIEVIFLLPWAVTLRELGFFGLVEVLIFVAILVVGYIWIWKIYRATM